MIRLRSFRPQLTAMTKGKPMNGNSRRAANFDPLAGAAKLLVVILFTCGCSKQNFVSASETTTQATFATPEEAGQALETANRAEDNTSMAHILGSRSQAILSSGDPTEDKAAAQLFAVRYDRMNRWVTMTDGSRVLYIGADNYPFPIPLAQDASSRWHFNTAAGEQELLARRIGRNELLAIDAATSMANAEELYYRKSHDGKSLHQYAQIILSSPGKQDGLHWEAPEGAPSSPLGRLSEFVNSAQASTVDGTPVFDGYTFRILTAQGAGARSGSKSYVVGGKLRGGFAIIASPVKYQDSGIMTFVVNREGVVYQKDLGSQTSAAAAALKIYNPADGWTAAE